jgi:alpha-tubulin suppressor-like RCC1 family protein
MDMDSSSGASTPPSSNMTSPEKSVLQEHTTMNGQVTRESYKYKFQPLPRQIPRNFFQNDDGSDDNVVMIDAQSRFTIAVSANGRLYTWGSGHCYQLGNEEMEDSPIPFCVTLKTRKCFWARCGGQFTMFLLGTLLAVYSHCYQ